jgi:ribosome-binding protein aMBF1 (putative translation factor)
MPAKQGPDVSDFIKTCVQDEGMSREEIAERLSQMADAAQMWVDRQAVKDANVFIVKKGKEWIEQSKTRRSPKMMLSEFWFQGELCILFADTNVGKSILAVQVGDMLARGASSNDLTVECGPQRVVYFDFELTDKQFEARLGERLPGEEFHTGHYELHDNFYRAELDPDTADLNGFKTFEEFLNHSLDKTISDFKANVLIVDNLTYLRDETENARNALPLMKYLKELKQKHGISILALAHTPKRDSSKPIGRNDLQGSKMLINFCDSSFAIGESQREPNLRYLKQIKARNTSLIYNSENVLLCNIEKRDNLLQFVFLTTGSEREHLKTPSQKDKGELIAKAREMNERGLSNREIAKELGVSHSTVSRYLTE